MARGVAGSKLPGKYIYVMSVSPVPSALHASYRTQIKTVEDHVAPHRRRKCLPDYEDRRPLFQKR